MNVTTHIETTSSAASVTSGAAIAKTSDQPQQAFSESLSAASKTLPETDSANAGNTKATNRKKSSSENTGSTSTVDQGAQAQSSVVSSLVVQPEQVVPVQQAQVTTPDGAPQQFSIGDAVSTADTATEKAVQASGVLPNIVQPSNDSSQTASTFANAVAQGMEARGASLPEAGNSLDDADANGSTNSAPNADSNKHSDAVTNVSADASPDAASSLNQNEVANPAQKSIQNAVLNAVSVASSGADTAPVLKTALSASVGAALASAASNAPKDQAIPLATAPDQTMPLTAPNASAVAANQVASLNKPSDGSVAAISAGVSNLKLVSKAGQSDASVTDGDSESKDMATDATSDSTGIGKHTKISADQSDSQAGAQQTTSSGDQSQSGASSQGQNAIPIQMTYASHPAIVTAQVQSTASASLAPSASQHAGVTSSAASSSLAAASSSDVSSQTLPVINTAKLIHSMGQSEMRVGMRSDEFGNISISTTASKDVITAQISLDHSELAKTLAAQLPEMQARLNSGQTVNVHIDMNSTGARQEAGQGAGQGSGTPGNTANSSDDQSRGGGQRSAYAVSNYASSDNVESQLSPVVASATTGYRSENSRLDIRV